MRALIALCFLAVSVRTRVNASAACTDDLDCSLNGDCVAGTCQCEPAWGGSPVCDQLAFLPSPAGSGYHNASGYASWGGNVLYEDGKYHLFVAQFAEKCSLLNWGSNRCGGAGLA